jgi:DNA-directed RNA polymerase subunit RPC12/RpoP
VCHSPETILVKGNSVYMCADCGQKFIQPPPKKG